MESELLFPFFLPISSYCLYHLFALPLYLLALEASSAAAIALGNFHTCVLLSAGGVVCRGNDDYGQLGIGGTTTVDDRDKNLKTVDLGTGSFATA